MKRDGFCHLDIKPESIIFTTDGKIKLIDFGVAGEFDDPVQSLKNFSKKEIDLFTAPEIREIPEGVSLSLNALKVDIYALGVTILKLINLELNH